MGLPSASAGAQVQSEKGRQSQTGSGSGTTTQMPIIPQEWTDFFKQVRGGLTGGGQTPEQKRASEYYEGGLGREPGVIQADISDIVRRYQFPKMDRSAYTEATLMRDYPSLYSKPTAKAFEVGEGGTGAAFRGAYTNPYQEEVVQKTIEDLGFEHGKVQNILRSQYGTGRAASGGEATGREQVESAGLAGDYLRDLGLTVGKLRQQGFQMGGELGQQDAARSLEARKRQAELSTDVSKFLGGQEAGRLQRDVGHAYTADELRDRATDRSLALLREEGATGATAAERLAETGGTGFGQLLNLLGLGTTTIGRGTDTEFKTKGASDYKTSGKGAQAELGYGK